MKKISLFLLLVVILLLLSACGSSVNQEDYDKLKDEAANLKTDLETKEKQLIDKEAELQKSREETEHVKSELDKLSKEIEPYINLSKAEAEDKLIKLEEEKEAREAAEKKKEEEEIQKAKKKAEEDRKAQEEKERKGYNTGITYNNLARTPDKYMDEKVKLRGKVIQVIEGDYTTQFRLAVNDDFEKIIYLEMDSELLSEKRVLEDDFITIYGVSKGLLTYESTMGGNITIPALLVDKFEFK